MKSFKQHLNEQYVGPPLADTGSWWRHKVLTDTHTQWVHTQHHTYHALLDQYIEASKKNNGNHYMVNWPEEDLEIYENLKDQVSFMKKRGIFSTTPPWKEDAEVEEKPLPDNVWNPFQMPRGGIIRGLLGN